jgi:hypothetical protein
VLVSTVVSQQTYDVVVSVDVVILEAFGEFCDAETPTEATYKMSRIAATIVIADFTLVLPSLANLRLLSSSGFDRYGCISKSGGKRSWYII